MSTPKSVAAPTLCPSCPPGIVKWSRTAHLALSLLDNIDPSLFREQRRALIEAAGDRESSELEGLVNLCDAIADFLADELGKDECLLVEDGNVNVLAGMKCPMCGSLGPFGIKAVCSAVVSDNGVDDATDYEWDSDDYCTCKACGFDKNGDSRVRDFRS